MPEHGLQEFDSNENYEPPTVWGLRTMQRLVACVITIFNIKNKKTVAKAHRETRYFYALLLFFFFEGGSL